MKGYIFNYGIDHNGALESRFINRGTVQAVPFLFSWTLTRLSLSFYIFWVISTAKAALYQVLLVGRFSRRFDC